MEVIKDYFRKWQNCFALPLPEPEPEPSPEPEPLPEQEIVKPIYNQRPTAYITSVSPSSATQGTNIVITFKGYGTDPEGSIVGYKWLSVVDGVVSVLSVGKSFTKSADELSVGSHKIKFRVKDDYGAWSPDAITNLTINPEIIEPPPDPCEGLTGDALKICRGEPVIPPPPIYPVIPPRPPGDISAATKAIQDFLDELRRRIREAYSGFCTFFGIPAQRGASLSELVKHSEIIDYI